MLTFWRVRSVFSKLAVILVILPQFLGAQTPSTVSLFTSPNPTVFGAPVTLTAMVTPADATGRVTFYDGTNVLGSSGISGGQATLITRLLPSGARSLRGYYAGDAGHTSSTSASVPQTVNPVAAGGFQAAVNYSAGTLPNATAAGDFNSDGKTDLAVANYGGGVSILLGNGDGSFQPAVSYAAGGHVYSLTVGDFNGDGKADLAVTNLVEGTVSILLGVGDGTFQAPVSHPAGRRPTSVTVADLNNDGNADLVMSNQADGTVSVLLGNGDGNFQAAVSYAVGGAGSEPQVLAVADLNGDGKTDLVVAVFVPGTICVLLGNGDGTLQSPVNYPVGGSNAGSVAVGDFNGDGKLDLVVGLFPTGVSVFLGNGDGTFQPPVTTGSQNYAGTLVVGDFNGDGKLDIAISDYNGNSPVPDTAAVTVLLGKGDGTLQSPLIYHVGTNPTYGVAIGDFNGDGRTDLAVTTYVDNTIGILLGQAATNPTVSAISVSPASGTGASQIFSFQFSDTAGSSDLATVSGLIGLPGWPASMACAVTYNVSQNTLALWNDDGSMPGTTITPGSGFQQNSWCAVDGSQSSVTRSGNLLQLSVDRKS